MNKKCIICGSDELKTRDTIVSDFVMARIDPQFEPDRKNIKTKLCFCRACTFAFYDYRLSPREESLLYRNYRDSEYQRTREKYECWYTQKVNNAINSDEVGQQQKIIREMLAAQGFSEFRTALDYGGNRGATFYKELGTEGKYVFDISGVSPLSGIIGLNTMEEIHQHSFDFIMCNMVFEHLSNPYDVLGTLYEIGSQDTVYYMEVPSENPFTNGNKFSIGKNLSLLLNRNYSWFRLVKYYFQQKKQPFMPMKEHVNFFTPVSFRTMAEKGGFCVLDVRETPVGNSTVLSMLFQKEQQ